ncbi:MAG: hypothetical protein R3Y21_00145 [Mycoplasmatota bacterium]
MKKIYIVLTFTNTVISKLIKIKTNHEFCHSSISLDKNLDYMYSFGRLNPYTPLFAGFVQEYQHKGTFKRFKYTKVQIQELEVTDRQYLDISQAIREIELNKKHYKFNIIGLVAAGANIKYKRKKALYCSEFVRMILEKANVDLTGIPAVAAPEMFKNLKNSKIIYNGLLTEYKS